MFKFKALPYHNHDLVVAGKDALNFVILKPKLEKALGSLASDNVKIRLVFGVVNVHPIDTLNPKSFLEGLSILKDTLLEIFKFVPYHKEGIEFRFGSDALHILVKMINEVISDQGKTLKRFIFEYLFDLQRRMIFMLRKMMMMTMVLMMVTMRSIIMNI